MKILRPDIVAMMIQARAYLAFHNNSNTNEYLDLSTFCFTNQQSKTTVVIDSHEWNIEKDVSQLYLESDIPGIGKNVLTEESRRKGIEIYTFAIQLFIIRTLQHMITTVYSCETTESNPQSLLFKLHEWTGFQRFLHSEYKRLYFSEVVGEFSKLEEKMLEMAENSKSKDYTRGSHINENYDVTHTFHKDMKVIEKRRAKFNTEIEELANITNHILTLCSDFEL